ncbi:ankyrin repeat domain-containing protein, partial [bacterium]|nr:ankyrin repeat domain-containing protein [bacterium]
IEYRRVEKKWSHPNNAGMGVAEPNLVEYLINMDLHASIAANGLKGQKMFVGSGFKYPNGSFVMPSIMSPQENYGNRGRVQFQTSDPIKYDQANWNDFTLKIPCKWIKFKNKGKKKYIATTYLVSGGLWIFADKEIFINPEKQEKKIILQDYLGNRKPFDQSDKSTKKSSFPKIPEQSSSAKLLFKAIEKNDINSAKFILENTSNISLKNESGETPLHVAAKSGNIEMAKLLIENSSQSGSSSKNREVNNADLKGNTPLHYAVLNDNVEMTKFLVSKGSRPDIKNNSGQTALSLAKSAKARQVVPENENLDEKLYSFKSEKIQPLPTLKKTISKYLVKLRKHDQEFKKHKSIFESLKNKPLNNSEIAVQVKNFINSGMLYAETMKLFMFDKYTRSGLLEEHEIIKRIRKNVEIIGKIYKDKTGKKLPDEASKITRQNRDTVLAMAVRTILKKKVRSFLKKKGLADLLQSKHYSTASNRVQRFLGINIKGYLDTLSRKHLGMGLGGFRSAKAAFRLQCRRIIKEKIADIILSFSGSGLLIKIAQKVILEWLEKNLWPKLREGFRPKLKLARRVSISINGLMDAREQLINMVGSGDPTGIPVNDIIKGIQNIRGKLAALRYLKKDLSRTDKIELIDDVAALEKIINRDLRRIGHQFLLDQQERSEEINDNVQWTFGILDEIHKLSAVTVHERVEFKLIRPKKRNIQSGYISTASGFNIPHYKVKADASDGVKPGLYRMEVRNNTGKYYFYTRKYSTSSTMTALGTTPTREGSFQISFAIPDLKSVKPLSVNLTKRLDEKEKSIKYIKGLKKGIEYFTKKLDHPKEVVRKRNMVTIADRYKQMASPFLRLDEIGQAKSSCETVFKILKQAGANDNFRIIADTWNLLSIAAFKSGKLSDFLKCRQNYINYKTQLIKQKSAKSNYRNKKSDLSNLANYYLKTAEWALILGTSPESIRPYFNNALKCKGYTVHDKNVKRMIYHYDNLKTVLGLDK